MNCNYWNKLQIDNDIKLVFDKECVNFDKECVNFDKECVNVSLMTK